MDEIIWGINPPKLVNQQVYYRKIYVYKIQNDKIIETRLYDYDLSKGYKIVLDNVKYKKMVMSYFNSFEFSNTLLTNSNIRMWWTFDTEKEAFIEKIKLLKTIRDIFYARERENTLIFEYKVPKKIEKLFLDIQTQSPEYFI